MQNLKQIPGVRNRFSFLNLEVDKDVERAMNLKLVQLLSLAPPGAVAYGTVEQIGSSCVAKLSIISSFRVFSAQATAPHPEKAVNRVLAEMEDQIFRWRFGGSRGGPSSFVHIPMTGSLA